MRFSILLAGLLLASPVLAQPNAANYKPADDAQKAAPASKPPSQAVSAQPAVKPEPPAQSDKDQTMGNFDVTGSSANDAMGSAPP